jgi:ribosomal protein S1
MPKLIENLAVSKRNKKDKIYCQEPYAQDLYDIYSDHFGETGKDENFTKDFKNGEIVKTTINKISDDHIVADTNYGQTLYLDLGREIKFFRNQGSEPAKGMHVDVMITDVSNSTGSAERAFTHSLKRDLRKSIESNDSAYLVTIKSVNDGGFMVDLNGLQCFMPGSLAAANKISDFESMIGKKVYVMAENYLDKSDMFVVSAKKYIKHVIPARLKELDFTVEYTGHVTGTTDYGVFIEWDEIFTALLHESEVGNDSWKSLRPGDEVKFYIKEVRGDSRIIASQKGPNPEITALLSFKENHEGEVYEGAEVVDIKTFGTFIKMGDVTGMMTPKEFKRYGRVSEGDRIDVYIKQVDTVTKRIYLRQPGPDMDTKLENLKNAFNRN